ncbi:MAG: ADOP family duplicated permease [Gemmatimonadales bacterium]
MTRPAPPRLAVWLLERLVPPAEREAFVGDLIEAYVEGNRTRRWFWRQTLAALRPFRSRGGAVEHAVRRPTRGGPLMLFAGLRQTANALFRAPAYAGVVLFTLALGIGATTAVFSVAKPVLFEPLPYPDPDRLAMIWEREPDGSKSNVGWETYADLVRDSRTIESAAAISYWAPVIGGVDDPERVLGQSVSASFFRTLGVAPAIGRDFSDEEDRGRHRVVIMSHRLFERRFGGDPSMVGGSVDVGGVAYTVIGVLPRGFESLLGPTVELWRPLGYERGQSQACRSCRHLRAVARLRSDVEPTVVADELDRLYAQFVEVSPTDYSGVSMVAEPLAETLTARIRPALLLALGAGLLVLLVAAVNVANLMIARSLEREHELAVRATLGAGRGRLAGQVLAEAWLLAVAGAVGGVALAALGLRLVPSDPASAIPRIEQVTIDWGVLLTAIALTVPITLLAGLLPALSASRRGARALGHRAATPSRARRRATGALVVVEVGLAVMLLAGAGLLIRSLARVLDVPPGFNPERLLSFQVTTSGSRYREDAVEWQAFDQLVERLEQTPGVRSVGFATQIPLGGNMDSYGVLIERKPIANPANAPSADRYAVSPGYLAAMEIPLLGGRGFEPTDRTGMEPVALINESFAAKSWPGEDPIGHRIQVGGSGWRRVVGVVGDVRHASLDTEQSLQFYVPATQWPWSEGTYVLVVRTTGSPQALEAEARAAVAAIDPALAVSSVATGEELIASATAARRSLMRLFQAFAGVALLLAGAGIYGLLARSVAERRRELGIRVALGAGRSRVVGAVLARGLLLTGAGLGLGLGGALALSGLIRGLLYGVGPTDAFTFVAVGVTLGALALLTSAGPAWRAAAIDPIEAINTE